MNKLTVFLCLLLLASGYFIYIPGMDSRSYPAFNDSQQQNILIILDSSYSMEESINGERKIDIAKRVINNALAEIPPNVAVGLRIYGHKSGFLGFNACRASDLVVPIMPNSQRLIKNELSKANPVGMTPITYSIQEAMNNDFIGIAGKKRIILVSDGQETCDGSPCDYILNLVRNHIDFKIDAIGFDLSDPAAISQLKCTSLATRGKFYSANNANELLDSLNKSLNIQKDVKGYIINKK